MQREVSSQPPPALGLPLYAPGMRIGLLGGSFNPPHQAHRAISLFAMKRLQLDRVWWLVSPGNPLKDNSSIKALAMRVQAADRVANHPRIDVTAFEDAIGTRRTSDTLDVLVRRCIGPKFVWLMGADNLAQFHRWHNWRGIAATMPIAVVDRAGMGFKGLASRAAQSLGRSRIPQEDAASLVDCAPPAWVFLTGIRLDLSSTTLRNPDGSWKT